MHAHNVYFSLKDQSSKAVQSLIDDCFTYLFTIDGILSFVCGTPEIDLNRDVNDQNFDVSLHVVFKSRQAHDDYQVDGRHHVFVERNKDNWAQVRVFDSRVRAR